MRGDRHIDPGPADVDRSDPAGRAWVDRAVAAVEADARRSADTHLLVYPLPPEWGVDLYLKDESTHPTGSLKHRLARSLFLYGLCSGQITEGSTVVEASSGSTAVSEAYFARMLGLPFVAVMPAADQPREDRADRVPRRPLPPGRPTPATVYDEARRIAAECRRPLPRPVHLRRAGHRLAGQQQHRRVDLRAAGPRAAPGARVGRRRRRHGRHERDDRPVPPLPAAAHPAGRRRPGGVVVLPRLAGRRPGDGDRPRPRASRASAGRGSSRRSCRRSSTG